VGPEPAKQMMEGRKVSRRYVEDMIAEGDKVMVRTCGAEPRFFFGD